MADTTDALLAERGKTHGSFSDHAQYTQQLKDVMRNTKNWGVLSMVQAEALEMIAHKIGRILAGDPSHQDHWDDIAGYARLVPAHSREQENKRIDQKVNTLVGKTLSDINALTRNGGTKQ